MPHIDIFIFGDFDIKEKVKNYLSIRNDVNIINIFQKWMRHVETEKNNGIITAEVKQKISFQVPVRLLKMSTSMY